MFFGVKIDNITYKQYSINGLYIKIDKKLIFEIDKLYIGDSKTTANTITDIKSKISKIPMILKFFQKIYIHDLLYNNDEISILFDENKLYIDSKDVKLIAKPHFISQSIKFNIETLYIKKYDINLNGQFILDYFKNNAFYLGKLQYKEQILELNVKFDMNYIDFYINSNNLSNIKVVKDFITLDPSIEKWLYENVQGTHNIQYLTFKFDINNNKIIKNSIELDSNVKSAKIKFKDNLSNVIADNLNIKYKNGTLNFKFDNPKYKTTLLDGSSLNINNLDNNNDSILHLNLRSNSILNNDIDEILQGYDINLPLKQSDGKLNTNLDINLNLNNEDLDIIGHFKLKNSNLNLSGFKFEVKNADVLLKDNIITIKSHTTYMLDKQLLLKEFNLIIDTSKQTASGKIDLDEFNIKTKNINILKLKDMKSDIYINFNNNIKIDLPSLMVSILNKEETTYIKCKNLAMYKDFSELLKDYEILDAKLDLEFANNNIALEAKIYKHASPIDSKSIYLLGFIENDNILLNINNKKMLIDINKNKTQIDIDGINIIKDNIKETDENKKVDLDSIFEVNARNSNILLGDNKQILSDKYSFIKHGNDIDFTSSYKDTKIKFYTKNKISTLKISNANDEFINSFLANNDFISGGSVDINANTQIDNSNIFKGSVKIKDTNFKDFAALNNVITLIQSSSVIANPLLVLPSLFRIVKGDMTLNGYKVLSGDIKYVYNHKDNFLNLYDIKTKGAEIDFDGEANLDLKNKIINSNIRVIFMKEISFLASKIPLVNKIFLDDSENISTNISIKGDIKNPVSEFVIFKD